MLVYVLIALHLFAKRDNLKHGLHRLVIKIFFDSTLRCTVLFRDIYRLSATSLSTSTTTLGSHYKSNKVVENVHTPETLLGDYSYWVR